MTIKIASNEFSPLPDELFSGDLSSLRELSLAGVFTSLPRKEMPNLTTFTLCDIPKDRFPLTRLLNFFESAPYIRYIDLRNSIPSSSDAPAERVVSLPHLKKLKITAQPRHATLLNHISIPAGASITLGFFFSGMESPIPSYLPGSSDGLLNLSDITSINLCFGPDRRLLQLSGPSGELQVLGHWSRGRDKPEVGVSPFVRSLSQFYLSGSRWLAIQRYHVGPPTAQSITKGCVYPTLCSMKNLYSLTLVYCKNLAFILTLNPKKNSATIVLCPKLKEITLHIEGPDDLQIDELLEMAEERASRGAKLSTMTIVSMALAPTKAVFQLRKHVSRVECKFEDVPPEWNALPAQVM